ncbi:hypothetical protein, partial [Phaeovulum veldkampii]|uniref:hypothetical protein n=1 Tax=Phaeovulum veldkampii TaxID=33049 RepID=UPI001AECA14A
MWGKAFGCKGALQERFFNLCSDIFGGDRTISLNKHISIVNRLIDVVTVAVDACRLGGGRMLRPKPASYEPQMSNPLSR